GQSLGHGGHHIGVNNGHLGDVVGVHADEFAALLHVGDDVVDGDFGSGAGGGGHGDSEHSVLLGGGHALQAAHVGKFRVVDDDADGFGSVHGRAAADGHDAVRFGILKGGHAVLDILDGGVGLSGAVEGIGKVCGIQQVGDLLGDTELDQVGVRADKGFFVTAAGQF